MYKIKILTSLFILQGAGFAALRLISPDNRGQHSTFTKKLSLPWKSDVFKGILQVPFVLCYKTLL